MLVPVKLSTTTSSYARVLYSILPNRRTRRHVLYRMWNRSKIRFPFESLALVSSAWGESWVQSWNFQESAEQLEVLFVDLDVTQIGFIMFDCL